MGCAVQLGHLPSDEALMLCAGAQKPEQAPQAVSQPQICSQQAQNPLPQRPPLLSSKALQASFSCSRTAWKEVEADV